MRGKISFPEKAIFFYVSKVYCDAMENATPEMDGIGKKNFDVWIPSIATAIEYDGGNWHTNTDVDSAKDLVCERNGARMIRVREPACPDYDTGAVIVKRETTYDPWSLDKAIREVMSIIGRECDIDTERDRMDILRMMGGTRSKKSFADKRPDVLEQWNYELNDGIIPESLPVNSKEEVWWNCPNGHKPFKRTVLSMCNIKSNGCPVCMKREKEERMRSIGLGFSIRRASEGQMSLGI
jgi:hypothetical protein